MMSDGTPLRHNLLPRTSGNLQETALLSESSASDTAQQHRHQFTYDDASISSKKALQYGWQQANSCLGA